MKVKYFLLSLSLFPTFFARSEALDIAFPNVYNYGYG